MKSPTLKIGVIGVGVVGAATLKGFQTKDMTAVGWDKFRSDSKDPSLLEEVLKADVIFVCVPTATNKETGEQDLEPLDETMALLHMREFKGAIVIKSTVLPGTTERMSKSWNLESQVAHNPEFLTAATPLKDFLAQPAVLIGALSPMARGMVQLVYEQAGFENIITYDSPTDTELAKYYHNLFLSVKVSFMNELSECTKAFGRDYDKVLAGALHMHGIGKGHTKVPGPDGHPGFGGMCFPKDTSAFLRFAKDQGLPHDVLEATVQANKRRRPDQY